MTGALGGSIRGRHLSFTPRLKEAAHLRELGVVTSMIDISDGLSTDLNHIARESRVEIEIDAARIPIHEDARVMAEEGPALRALARADA